MLNSGRPWSSADDALLGTDIDRVIARKLGRSSVAVSSRRKKLGIPPAINGRRSGERRRR
jgi:hypothetical protein